jgi:hypothetical protein
LVARYVALPEHPPVVRRLTGYDVTTERLAFQTDIPEGSWPEARDIARLPTETEVALVS